MAVEELVEFERQRAALRSRLAKERIVVMDFRHATVLPPQVADSLVSLLSPANPGLLRNGVLVPDSSAIVALQLQRIVRAADNDRRRVFRERAPLEAWLGEVLDIPERARLKLFLND
jgi:hypothetical protein